MEARYRIKCRCGITFPAGTEIVKQNGQWVHKDCHVCKRHESARQLELDVINQMQEVYSKVRFGEAPRKFYTMAMELGVITKEQLGEIYLLYSPRNWDNDWYD